MRLIDADKLHYHRVWIVSIKKGEYNGMKSAVVVFADEIDKNKKARMDAVPVVRCKDCKWWVREGNDSYGYAMFCDHDCSLGGQGIKKPEDYCSYGERKGGDSP